MSFSRTSVRGTAVILAINSAVILAVISFVPGCSSDVEVKDSDAGAKSQPVPLKVLTFNVMCSVCNDDQHDKWLKRLPHLKTLLADYDADIVGLQELMPKELSLFAPNGDEPARLIDKLPQYTALYWQATNTDAQWSTYPDATIYLRKSRFDVLEQGSFWLGPTPEEPLTSGFIKDPTLPRVVVWARIKDNKAGAELYVANTHFDANNPNQQHSAELVMGRLPQSRDLRDHMIFTGDFNANPSDPAFKALTAKQKDGAQLRESHDIAAETSITHEEKIEPQYEPKKRIDHIFVGSAFSVTSWTVDMKRFGPNDRYPSDHFLIAAELLVN